MAKHFGDRLPVIGFCGAPFTLASYMIEGGGSRNYVHAKKMMYNSPADWDALMRKLVAVTTAYSAEQVRAGADVIQIFDSWVGCLSVEDYRRYVLPHVTGMVKQLQKTGAPIIYFGTDSATLLPAMKETGADVVGLDWRIPLDEGWARLDHTCAVQGNLDPVLLFADWKELRSRAEDILSPRRRAAGPHLQSRPRHSAGNSGGECEEPGALRAGVCRAGLPVTARAPKAGSRRFMTRIAIIGGGISGLAAAFELEEQRRRRAQMSIMFSTNRRRGWAACFAQRTFDGCIVEAGPDSFITEKPWASDLCRDVGTWRSAHRLQRCRPQDLHSD